jgi:Domain of unknown function (DUF4376)
MNPNKRRFYYDSNGYIFFETNVYGETSVDEEIASFKVLSERNRETFDVLEIPYGQYAQDFAECNGYRVNPETLELEFSYPDPNNPEAPQVFQKPLSEQVKEIESKLKTADEKYKELDLNTATIEEVRQLKIEQLKYLCTHAIYHGFSSVNGYEFGFNAHDQSNFEKMTAKINLWKHLLAEGKLTQADYDSKFPIKWKTKNNGIVELTEDEYIQVTDDAEAHLLAQQIKYWQLEAQVLAATTKEEIDAINW